MKNRSAKKLCPVISFKLYVFLLGQGLNGGTFIQFGKSKSIVLDKKRQDCKNQLASVVEF
jgi:hypothetical protein